MTLGKSQLTLSIIFLSIIVLHLELEEDRTCDAVLCDISSSLEPNPMWVGCECGKWYHVHCLGFEHPCNQTFVCENCQEILAEL